MYLCLVLFVVSKILDSSKLLSGLLEMGVEYYLVFYKKNWETSAVVNKDNDSRRRTVRVAISGSFFFAFC